MNAVFAATLGAVRRARAAVTYPCGVPSPSPSRARPARGCPSMSARRGPPHHLPARLLRRLRHRGRCAATGAIRASAATATHPVSRGRLCRKCTLGLQRRLPRPRRPAHDAAASAAGAKGAGAFAPVSWDEALGAIAERLTRSSTAPGRQAILNAHYTGTCSLLGYRFPLRFFNRLGATEVDPDTICNNAGHVALRLPLRRPRSTASTRAPRRDAALHPRLGRQPVGVGAPPARALAARGAGHRRSSSTRPHRDGRGAPTCTSSRSPAATPRSPSRCCTSLAATGCVDRGVPRRPHRRLGRARAARSPACTPAWAEAATGVPAAAIERGGAPLRGGAVAAVDRPGPPAPAARRQRRARRARCCRAATGNLGRPGTGFLYLNGADEPRHRRGLPRPARHLAARPRAAARQPHGPRRAPRGPARAGRSSAGTSTSRPRTPSRRGCARALRARGPLHRRDRPLRDRHHRPRRRRAARRELPRVRRPRRLLLPPQPLRPGQGVAEPPGEALPNTEIFRRLAAAMGFDEPELHEPDDAVIATLLERAGHRRRLRAAAARRARSGPATSRWSSSPARAFATPSGRIELASAAAQADGLPAPPLPIADPRPAGGALRLLTPGLAVDC